MYNNLKLTVFLPYIVFFKSTEETAQNGQTKRFTFCSDHHVGGCVKQMGKVSLESYPSGSVLLEDLPFCQKTFIIKRHKSGEARLDWLLLIASCLGTTNTW